ncbi:MAG: carboxypeptidase-like regulatory domain-containing protein [Parabacteroides sp.]|nr:carboxypeptidase-like regulatory domain-containing protein [Parabacteroides sp.]
MKDEQTGDELIGASVFVKEHPEIGATTGLDGTFVLKNVPEVNTVTLVGSYISYQTQEQVVKTTSSQPVFFAMKPSEMQLEGVVIVASADKSTDNSTRAMEKNAAAVLNIVSAKSIEISPDLNVARSSCRAYRPDLSYDCY